MLLERLPTPSPPLLSLPNRRYSYLRCVLAVGGGKGAGGPLVELIGPTEPVEPIGDRLGGESPLGRPRDVERDPAPVHEQEAVA